MAALQLLLTLLLGSPSALVQPVTAASAADVKAELVRRLTHYVTWPTAPTPPTGFVVCVMEDTVMEDALRGMVKRAEDLQGKACTVRRLAAGESVSGCQLTWVGAAAASHAAGLKRNSKQTQTLLVTDELELCGSGSHIVLAQRSKGFGVHVDRAGTSEGGFSISSKLLRVARPCP